VTFKPELGVTEGHWKCHHSIQRMRLSIGVQYQLWLYVVSFLKYSMSKNVVTLKSGSEVTQGHWKWFPISVL